MMKYLPFVDVKSFTIVTRTHPRVPETEPRASAPGTSGLTNWG
jgi:hypothetical protein